MIENPGKIISIYNIVNFTLQPFLGTFNPENINNRFPKTNIILHI